MNAEVENGAEVDPQSTNDTGPDTERDHLNGERRIIGDAIARGSTVTRWIAMITGLLFIASGLWWAGILVLVVTTFDLPRVAAQSYARKRGVRLSVPSATEVERTSVTGLLIGAVFLPVVCGLVLAEMVLGHPLLPWSWTTPLGEQPVLWVVLPLAVCALAITVVWVVRRLTDSRQTDSRLSDSRHTSDSIDSQKGSA